MAEWFNNLHPVLQALIRSLTFVGPMLVMVALVIWFERRLLGWFQDRQGPNRVGTITLRHRDKWVPAFLKGKKISLQGLIQPFADITKLVVKEEIQPSAADLVIYVIGPGLALFPSIVLGATIPWGPYKPMTPVADVNIGVLWILAVASLGVYGVVLSGYASNNKYSLLGGLRSSAQLISYELGLGISLACIVLATGSLKPTDIVVAQQEALWGLVTPLANWFILTPHGFIAAIVFFICMVAETNRAPFDLPEAENELVAGYHTEYSSAKFASYFMGEYAAMIVYGGIFTTVFLGGYHMLPVRFEYLASSGGPMSTLAAGLHWADFWLAPLWFLGKVFLIIFVYIWLRATLPRMRYDQLMSLGWRTLLPVATVNLIVVAMWLLLQRLLNPALAFGIAVATFGLLYWLLNAVLGAVKGSSEIDGVPLESRSVRMVQVKANVPVVEVPEPSPEGGAA
jgi:NADH-quinone oxidoreductase subunit H